MTNKFLELYEQTSKNALPNEIKQKNGYNYLSWALAWKHFKTEYPEGRIETINYPDANGNLVLPYLATEIGYFVGLRCYLTNNDFEHKIYTEFVHPVLDFSNRALKAPTSQNINNSLQRARAKVIAMASGIGLAIYSNEDLPAPDTAPQDKTNIALDWLESSKDIDEFNSRLDKTLKKVPDLKSDDYFQIEATTLRNKFKKEG